MNVTFISQQWSRHAGGFGGGASFCEDGLVGADETLLAGLDPQQQAAVTAPRGPVCVLAGAGTGKTRTITHRVAYLVHRGLVAPHQVLAVTFTTRAANEMRTRLRALDVHAAQARTFHSAALRQLSYFWPRVIGGEPWPLLDNKSRLVNQAIRKIGATIDAESLRDITGEIEWAKACLVTPADFPLAAAKAQRDMPLPAEQLAAVYAHYEELKTLSRQLDFDDLLLHTAAALEDNAEIAGEFRDRYRCFIVDEYQDVNPLQQRVLSAWLGARDDLTVVGDANQTIYSFAGATSSWLLDFPRRFPGATLVRLERNYRSSPQIVTLANQVISAAQDRPAGSRLALQGCGSAGPQPEFAEFDCEPAEAAAVAQQIQVLLKKGVPASEIAVLFRINAQSEVYEQALAEAEIPYQVRGGERFFARTEVRQAVQALRSALRQTLPDAQTLVAQVQQLLLPIGLTKNPPPGGAARARWESLRALVDLAAELSTTLPETDLARFVAELDQRAQAQHPPTVAGVTLASLHAAKGLEWDSVFLVGLAEGTMPLQRATGDSERQAGLEEERRLFYVGVTRARRYLWLSWALARTAEGYRHRRRSRFLYRLIPEHHPTALGSSIRTDTPNYVQRAKLTPSCRVCQSALISTAAIKLGRCADCPSSVDVELLERLKAWRSDRAKQLKVPTYVVFTDATLTAIAEQRPIDSAGLVAISGIGTTKLDRFGAEVLSLVQQGQIRHAHGELSGEGR